MHDSMGSLSGLDPDASEPLKVIAYFDVLIREGAGLRALVRGAAALSGTVAGVELRGVTTRSGPDGKDADSPLAPRSSQRDCAGGSVWLERDGDPQANDDVIAERFALAVDVLETRNSPTSELEIVLDRGRRLHERTTALARLRIDPRSRVRVVATSPEQRRPPSALSMVIPTPYGILRATLCRNETLPDASRAGIGQWATADHAFESWEGAYIAWRLTTPELPVIDATELGALLLVARSYDPESPHEEVRALARLDAHSAKVLLVLVEADSIRSAATTLGMHHSTLQAKHAWLTQELGYDPRTVNGRVRYGTAELLRRLTDPRALR